jgi:hypothetical protein
MLSRLGTLYAVAALVVRDHKLVQWPWHGAIRPCHFVCAAFIGCATPTSAAAVVLSPRIKRDAYTGMPRKHLLRIRCLPLAAHGPRLSIQSHTVCACALCAKVHMQCIVVVQRTGLRVPSVCRRCAARLFCCCCVTLQHRSHGMVQAPLCAVQMPHACARLALCLGVLVRV